MVYSMNHVNQTFQDALRRVTKEDVLAEWSREALSRRGETSSAEETSIYCFTKFVNSDLRKTAQSSLPPNIESWVSGTLEGMHILQIDEMFNCAVPARQRYEDKSGARLLKMHCTDGFQNVVAIEYAPILELQSTATAGCKILVKDVPVRRGALMLSSACVWVMGGILRDLEVLQREAMQEWNRIVCGELGIKKEQCVDSIDKLQAKVYEKLAGQLAVPIACDDSDKESSSLQEDINVQSNGTRSEEIQSAIPQTPYTNIKIIQEKGGTAGVHRLLCTILCIKGLTISNQQYRLEAKIEDGSGILDVVFAPNIVYNIFNKSCDELKRLSDRERLVLSKKLEKAMLFWEGCMEIQYQGDEYQVLKLLQPNALDDCDLRIFLKL